MKQVFIIVFLLFLSACTSGNLPNYNQLGDLRVITLIADRPEVSPGDAAVNITPIISDLNGGTRTLSWSALGCPDPGVGIGATPSCAGTPDVLAPITPVTINSTTDPKNVRTLVLPAFSVAVPAAATLFAQQSLIAQYNGVNYLIFFTLTASDGTTITSFKRLVVSTRSPKNQNPLLNNIKENGSILTVPPLINPIPSVIVVLSPNVSAASVENYTTEQADGTFISQTEQLTLTWFYSDGAMNTIRTQNTDPNGWSPPSTEPTTRSVVLITVLRDGRGGESFIINYF